MSRDRSLNRIWTEEMDGELQGLLLDGLTARQIAERMQLASRHSVIGRAFRRGFKFKKREGVRPTPPSRSVTQRSANTTPPPFESPLFPVAESLPNSQSAVEHGPDNFQHIAQLRQVQYTKRPGLPVQFLKRTGCAYPLWGPEAKTGEVCNAQVKPGQPYCPKHYDLCSVPVRGRAR